MRALLSVYDKRGIVEFARRLSAAGWDLLSSGGTAGALREAGIEATSTADYTGSPAILGHRVVTLHPKVHGGILADREDPEHRADLERYGIEPVDLVVCNLYPFSAEPSVETIDVGGPAMLRAAAKNFRFVTVVPGPEFYEEVLLEIESGGTSLETRRRLARETFRRTAAYDREISSWLETSSEPEDLPRTFSASYEKVLDLRYGENPHQRAAYYAEAGREHLLSGARKVQGKDLSFNNLYDVEAARALLSEFGSGPFGGLPAAVVVKHANPCGAAVGRTPAEAYEKALASDPVSAYGGIVALNEPLDGSLARKVSETFTEVLISPLFTAEALETFQPKPNAVLLEAGPLPRGAFAAKPVTGGVLLQDADETEDASEYEVVTQKEPSEEQMRDLLFAWRVAKRVKSNAIVLAKGGATVGVGAGQMSRVDSSEIAVKKAAGRVRGSVAASDAFFPFADGVEALARAGVGAVIQPGGSKRDAEVIEAANRAEVPMIFTKKRHFLH